MNNNNKIFNYVSIGVVILLIFALFSNKDSFKTIREETDDLYNEYYRNTTYTNQIVPAQPNNIVTKTDLQDLLKTLIGQIEIEAAWEVLPSMQQIFIETVTAKNI